MKHAANIQNIQTSKETRERLKMQLAQYLSGQSETVQSVHRWMKCLEAASAGLIAGGFIMAVYVSIAYQRVNPALIPLAWFFFAASPSLMLILNGMHSILLRAAPAIVLPGKVQSFTTGRRAILSGAALILGGLLDAAFWGIFIYATWMANWSLLTPLITILGVVMGVGIAVSILLSMAQKILKLR